MLKLSMRAAGYASAATTGVSVVAIAQYLQFHYSYVPLPNPPGATQGTELAPKHEAALQLPSDNIPPRPSVSTLAQSCMAAWKENMKKFAHRTKDARMSIGQTSNSVHMEQRQDQQTSPRRHRRVFFVGDSLIAGVGGHDRATLPRRVARVLADELEVDVQWRVFSNVGADVAALHQNLIPFLEQHMTEPGWSGKNLKVDSEGNVDMKDCIVEREERVDAIIVMCGLNDWKRVLRGDKSPAQFRCDLELLTTALHDHFGHDCRVVMPALPVHWITAFPEPLRTFVLHLADAWDEQKRQLAIENKYGKKCRKQFYSSNSDQSSCTPAETKKKHEQKAVTISLSDSSDSLIFAHSTCSSDDPTQPSLHTSQLDFVPAKTIKCTSTSAVLASDGVHPNDHGYRVWADHIAETLGQLLRKQEAAQIARCEEEDAESIFRVPTEAL